MVVDGGISHNGWMHMDGWLAPGCIISIEILPLHGVSKRLGIVYICQFFDERGKRKRMCSWMDDQRFLFGIGGWLEHAKFVTVASHV